MSVANSLIESFQSIPDVEFFKGIAVLFLGFGTLFLAVIGYFAKIVWNTVIHAFRERMEMIDEGLKSWSVCNQRVGTIEKILTDHGKQNDRMLDLHQEGILKLNTVQISIMHHSADIGDLKKRFDENIGVLANHDKRLVVLETRSHLEN